MKVYKNKEKFKKYIREKNGGFEHIQTYLIYNENYNLYKIGSSYNPKRRFKEINKKHKGSKLLFIINNNYELRLHRTFNHKMVKINNEREWFDLSSINIFFIKTLQTLR